MHRRRKLRAEVRAAEDICWLCGHLVDPDLKHPHPWSASIDEIIPISRGGSPYDRDNCRLAHLRCNQSRGNGAPASDRSSSPTEACDNGEGAGQGPWGDTRSASHGTCTA